MNTLTARRRGWRAWCVESWQVLRHWPWRDTLLTLRQRFREDHIGLTASSLTFTTLLALVPLTTMAFALFSAFPVFGAFQVALEKYFLQALVPETISRQVLGTLTQFAAKARRLSGLGLVLLGVTAVATMLTIDRALNAIWAVRRPRPIGQRVLVYWAAITLGPLVLGISLTVTSYALSASQGWVHAPPWGVSLLLNVVEFSLLVAGIAALFHYVPNTLVRWPHAFAGALFVGVAFEGAKDAIGWYFSKVPTYSAVYGAYVTLPVLMVWVYAGWVIVLLGAVIAASAQSLSQHTARLPSGPGQPFALALGLLRVLAAAQREGRPGRSQPALARTLGVDPLRLEPVVDTLVALDWVGRLEEGGAQRLVLLCDPARTPAAPLIDRLLLEPSAAARAFRAQAGVEAMSLEEALR
ncbi:YihY family inner membrane protein [Azohydromonas aeria]|uniref:YihY family inner membrane protein n=1 Tax=Azohydromonas aeria TaxID=2590212 RepID=UPI0012FA00E4|nr:YihY family inner membrane protein [Azohydromonas aeria]